jgi:hypothetical protein
VDRSFKASRKGKSKARELKPSTLSRPDSLLSLQAVVGNQVVQRLIGQEGTNQAGKTINPTFAPEFIRKHIADNVEDAKKKTRARIASGDALPTMENGILGNIVATEGDWKAAIEASPMKLPPDNEWFPAEDAKEDDDASDRLESADVVVSGWDIFEQKLANNKGFTYTVVIDPAAKRTIGGDWAVTDKNVSLVVDHASSGKN